MSVLKVMASASLSQARPFEIIKTAYPFICETTIYLGLPLWREKRDLNLRACLGKALLGGLDVVALLLGVGS